MNEAVNIKYKKSQYAKVLVFFSSFFFVAFCVWICFFFFAVQWIECWCNFEVWVCGIDLYRNIKAQQPNTYAHIQKEIVRETGRKQQKTGTVKGFYTQWSRMDLEEEKLSLVNMLLFQFEFEWKIKSGKWSMDDIDDNERHLRVFILLTNMTVFFCCFAIEVSFLCCLDTVHKYNFASVTQFKIKYG